MGCGGSKGSEGTAVMVQNLTDADKEQIKTSWSKFCEGDRDEAGAHLFISMFQKRPDIKDMFRFAKDQDVSSEEFRQSRGLKSHTKRYFDIFGQLVSSVDNLSGAEYVLGDIGGAHYSKKVSREHFTVMEGFFLEALQKKLDKDTFTKSKTAWKKLYGIASAGMITGLDKKKAEAD